MGERKKPLQQIVSVLILLVAVVVLFQWYTAQNKARMEERNKEYASNSAQMMASQIDEEFQNAEDLISTYAYCLGKSLTGPEVTKEAVEELRKESLFDAMLFTDADGVDYAPDGRTANAEERKFYLNGMAGESGMSVLFDSDFTSETMASFFAPVYYDGEVIGVLRGSYLAEEYLKDMLYTTYFGEQADVYQAKRPGDRKLTGRGRRL